MQDISGLRRLTLSFSTRASQAEADSTGNASQFISSEEILAAAAYSSAGLPSTSGRRCISLNNRVQIETQAGAMCGWPETAEHKNSLGGTMTYIAITNLCEGNFQVCLSYIQ